MNPNFKVRISHFFLELLFPSFCIGCNLEGTILCRDCESLLETIEHRYCLCAKDPLRIPPNIISGTCNRCGNNELSGLHFALAYHESPLARKILQRFKYPPYLKKLGSFLASRLALHLVKTGNNTNAIWEGSLLVPVPLEHGKMRKRGYNQSEVLARELAMIVKAPVVAGNLVKLRPTRPQMELGKAERSKNLEKAFFIKNPAQFKGRKIFLVDDVYTTGATMRECARLLRNAGATSVWGLAAARES